MTTVPRGTPEPPRLNSGAVMSADGVYRWSLWRRWADGPLLGFVMLNPSTADADLNDATTRRCIGFAKREGYSGITLRNLFGLRTKNPQVLYGSSRLGLDVVGPEADEWLDDLLEDPDQFPKIVLAWGKLRAPHRSREAAVIARLRAHSPTRLYRLDPTPPRGPTPHPLYLPEETPIVPYLTEGAAP